mgnify:CR=1 FL=1
MVGGGVRHRPMRSRGCGPSELTRKCAEVGQTERRDQPCEEALYVFLANGGCGGDPLLDQDAKLLGVLCGVLPRRVGGGISARTCTRLLTEHLAGTEFTNTAQHLLCARSSSLPTKAAPAFR